MKKARWFFKAAEGGYVRAMYNLSLCYSCGEGLVHNHQQAKKWMKRAADRGHSKAQFEHGLHLFSVRFFPTRPQRFINQIVQIEIFWNIEIDVGTDLSSWAGKRHDESCSLLGTCNSFW